MNDSTLKPFHEAIVDAISHARSALELSILAYLINHATIPKNHEAIIAAWNTKVAELGYSDTTFDITKSVKAQKQRHQMDPVKSRESIREAAEEITKEVWAMSKDEALAYIHERNLGDLLKSGRIEAVLARVMGNPTKAANLILVWDRDRDGPKSED